VDQAPSGPEVMCMPHRHVKSSARPANASLHCDGWMEVNLQWPVEPQPPVYSTHHPLLQERIQARFLSSRKSIKPWVRRWSPR